VSDPVQIPLAGGRVTLVDEPTFKRLGHLKWHLKRSQNTTRLYAQRTVVIDGKKTAVALHREVMRAKPGDIVDHVNNEPLDNRRCNLRICSARENAQNVKSSNQKKGKYKGVYASAAAGRWCAAIAAGEKRPNGKRKRVHLGSFDSPELAAQAYDRAALKHFGAFASLNFPEMADFYVAMRESTSDGRRGCR
jgi:hypothetical protein